MNHPYWHKQSMNRPLYPDIEWSKPEQLKNKGRLGIIGGNKISFKAAAESYGLSLKTGAGEVRVLLPDVLKKSIPSTITEVIYGRSNPSGGLGRESLTEMKAMGEWATGVLLIGDAGRNSETAILYEDFVREYAGPLTITRDAVDMMINNAPTLVERPETLIITSFAQLQKLFQAVYFPKVLTFSMQLTNLVEAVHKFTISYPISVAVFHQDTLVVAGGGEVTSTPYDNPMKIWQGDTATVAAVHWLWSPTKILESVTTSLVVGR